MCLARPGESLSGSGGGGGSGAAGTERGGRKALSKSRGKAERRACGSVFGRSMRPCPVVPASDAVYLPPRRAAVDDAFSTAAAATQLQLLLLLVPSTSPSSTGSV